MLVSSENVHNSFALSVCKDDIRNHFLQDFPQISFSISQLGVVIFKMTAEIKRS